MTDFAADHLRWTDDALWPQFAARAQAAPETTALIEPDGAMHTRGALAAQAQAAAAQLQRAGIGRGDRVLLQARKNADTAAAALALSSLGAITCPMAPDLGRAEREVLQQRLNHAALLAADLAGAAPVAGLRSLQLQLRDRAEIGPADARDADTALIGFTSGTTGVPKGVMHGSAAMNYACSACADIAGLEPGEAIAGLVPLASAPGFTFSLHFGLARGHPLVLVDPWDPLSALQAMDQHGCRWTICVPTQLAAMLECARAGQWSRPSPLRALAVGGSAMTPELVADAERLLGLRALRMFGMSECMGHASTHPQDPIALRRGSDGKPFAGTVTEAFDADGRLLPRGQRGQAGVRGPSLFIGYCQGLGEHDARFTPEGFFLTGDEIVRDTDGHLRVVGRLKDQIIRGGYNIDPAEVEAALLKHPAMSAAAVVAVPDRRLGEQACAACCIRDTLPAPTLDELRHHLDALGLSRRKWPEHLLILPRLPHTATGKVDKKRLAQLAQAALAPR